MVVLLHVAEFMDDDIIDAPVRRNNDPPVEHDIPLSTATAPSGFVGPGANRGGTDPHNLGVPLNFLPKLRLSMLTEPACQGAPDSVRTVCATRQGDDQPAPCQLHRRSRSCFDLKAIVPPQVGEGFPADILLRSHDNGVLMDF